MPNFKVLLKLGFLNVWTVFIYRLLLKLRYFKITMPVGSKYKELIFKNDRGNSLYTKESSNLADIIKKSDNFLKGNISFFSKRVFHSKSPIDWDLNLYNSKHVKKNNIHWSVLSDFSLEIGDIKCVWELSRFSWAVLLARGYRETGNESYLDELNLKVSDWIYKNPVNAGVNWKCGQECAIRVINVFISAFVIGQEISPSEGMMRFVEEHCSRIEPTIRYAISQDNNHGTSEAAALFICGGWLEKCAINDKQLFKKAIRWKKKGRFWLENRVKRLIPDDGSFSQYSVYYHRLVVDTLSLVKLCQKHFGLKDFSQTFQCKAGAAVLWLFNMTDPLTGNVPNIGANDGSLLLDLTDCGYRDFRPSVQLGAVLFLGERVYRSGQWDDVLLELGLEKDSYPIGSFTKNSREFSDGGYVTFISDSSWGVARIPHYRFRPSHADALNFDLWHKGRNILRDGGSYSYNCDEPWQSYFPGTGCHNTVEFDGRDQMPRLSRFLWGAWTEGETVEPLSEKEGCVSWAGAYSDYLGCRHKRRISLSGDIWRVTDFVAGFREKAVLRWRLEPGEWELQGNVCRGNGVSIEIKGNVSESEVKLSEGWQSLYYMEKSSLPVLEVLLKGKACEVVTEIRFS